MADNRVVDNRGWWILEGSGKSNEVVNQELIRPDGFHGAEREEKFRKLNAYAMESVSKLESGG